MLDQAVIDTTPSIVKLHMANRQPPYLTSSFIRFIRSRNYFRDTLSHNRMNTNYRIPVSLYLLNKSLPNYFYIPTDGQIQLNILHSEIVPVNVIAKIM